jgi:hypothetical protein
VAFEEVQSEVVDNTAQDVGHERVDGKAVLCGHIFHDCIVQFLDVWGGHFVRALVFNVREVLAEHEGLATRGAQYFVKRLLIILLLVLLITPVL